MFDLHFKTTCPCCHGAGYTVHYVNIPEHKEITRVDGAKVTVQVAVRHERVQSDCYHCRGTGFAI